MTANGFTVLWAETAEEARQHVLDIARQHQTHSIAKAKSMATEEIALNDALLQAGLHVVETDLGEYILQINDEHPSHIIAPVIHKSKDEIRRIFQDKLDMPYIEEAQPMVAFVREKLRQEFISADMGITGGNFVIMSARDNILKRLRGITPFADYPAPDEKRIVAPVPDDADLVALFMQKAELLSAQVYRASSQKDALEHLLGIIGDDASVLAWDFEHIPLDNLAQALEAQKISIAPPTDASVRVGITGADVALAVTGSLVVSTRAGKPRQASLLPYVHVAVIRREQILPHFEAWLHEQQQDLEGFREIGNHIIITGASRTADIGMELVLGAHGPATLHIIVV